MLATVLRRWPWCYPYFVWLCGFYCGTFRVFFLILLSVLVFFSPVSLGKSVLFVLLFVYFARVNFCPFSLPLGVRDWLRFVIVALLLVSGIGCGL